MNKTILWTAIVAVLCLVWALSIPDLGIVALIGLFLLLCLYGLFKKKSTNA